MDVERERQEWVVEDDDDGFYKVVVPSDITKWRTQAKLVVAPKSSSWSKDGCSFGLYQRGSHDVVTIPECEVHHPSINRAVNALSKATNKVGTAAFQKDSREGGLRYVQFQLERTTGKICLVLVWAASELKYTQPALSRLIKELARLEPDLWHSVWCHCNESPGNNIFSRNPKNWYRMSGPEFVREPLPVGDQGWLYFSPLAFRQGNMDGFDILANDVARAVPGGSKVCELYAGVGLLGLTSLVYHSQRSEEPLVWVRCSDENPANPRSFRRSVSSL
jgi:23S rRNA (uracil1939-C5)-methyltransferase